jgi:molybdate transport system ATP-binding protein
VLVTHDPLEASALADAVVVIEDGRVVQTGTQDELAAHPRSPYVARMAGTNLFRGTASGHRVAVDGGGELDVATPAEGPVLAVVHPRAVAVSRRRPEGSPRNVWEGTVDALDALGDRVRVRVEGALPIVAEITDRSRREMALGEGEPVWVSLKATEIDVSPA